MAAGETDRATVLLQLESYRRDLARALSAAEHAWGHLGDGDVGAACNVLSETAWELERARQDYHAIVEALETLRGGEDPSLPHLEAAQQVSVERYRCEQCGGSWDGSPRREGDDAPLCPTCDLPLLPERRSAEERGASPQRTFSAERRAARDRRQRKGAAD
jgi:hypothetical protein